jgi:hypothetical protein
MTRTEARTELKRAHLAASNNPLVPGFSSAVSEELAVFYAPGPWGARLTDAELDARQEQRMANLLEVAANGSD